MQISQFQREERLKSCQMKQMLNTILAKVNLSMVSLILLVLAILTTTDRANVIELENLFLYVSPRDGCRIMMIPDMDRKQRQYQGQWNIQKMERVGFEQKLSIESSYYQHGLRSWVQIPPCPLLTVLEIRYCFEFIFSYCRTDSAAMPMPYPPVCRQKCLE